jgi:hypothetical protein
VLKLIIRHGPRATPVWMGPIGDPPPRGIQGPEPIALARALKYALRRADGEDGHGDIELWNVKECRRSSIWRLRLGDRALRLNVARRDSTVGELITMGRELRALHERDPLGVADVVEITPEVVAGPWIDGMELHVVDRGDGRGLFIAVEESLPAGNGRQLMLTGREGVPASDAIWASWLEALVRQTTADESGALSRPHVEACEGDLLLLNEQPVLVGLSPGPLVRDRAGWERDLLDLRSGEHTRAFRWGDRASARHALRRALATHGEPRPGARSVHR